MTTYSKARSTGMIFLTFRGHLESKIFDIFCPPRYVILVIKKDEVSVEKIGEKEATYDMFLEDLKQKDESGRADCRYAGQSFIFV